MLAVHPSFWQAESPCSRHTRQTAHHGPAGEPPRSVQDPQLSSPSSGLLPHLRTRCLFCLRKCSVPLRATVPVSGTSLIRSSPGAETRLPSQPALSCDSLGSLAWRSLLSVLEVVLQNWVAGTMLHCDKTRLRLALPSSSHKKGYSTPERT